MRTEESVTTIQAAMRMVFKKAVGGTRLMNEQEGRRMRDCSRTKRGPTDGSPLVDPTLY